MTTTITYPYRLWHHNGAPLAQSVAAAIAQYERVFGVEANVLLAPAREAARVQEVTTLSVEPDPACLPGHIMVGHQEAAV